MFKKKPSKVIRYMENFDFDKFYSRHFPLPTIGYENQSRLKYRTVLVAGVGGIGTGTAELLAGLGIGRIILVDYDTIEQSNLPRQRLYSFQDIGAAKVDIAKQKLEKLNPSVSVEVIAGNIINEMNEDLLNQVDVVVDGLDKFSSRFAIHKACQQYRTPYVFAGAIGTTANIMTINFAQHSPCLICAIGYPKDSLENTCQLQGVHPSILSIVSAIQASEALKLLLGQPPVLVGRMLYIDLEGLDFEKIKFSRSISCPACLEFLASEERGEIGDTKKSQLQGSASITSLCGKDTYIFQNIQLKTEFAELEAILNAKWKVENSGASSISIRYKGFLCTILKDNVLIIKGAGSKKNAVNVYSTILKEF